MRAKCMLPVHTKMFEVVLGRSCEASTPADWPAQNPMAKSASGWICDCLMGNLWKRPDPGTSFTRFPEVSRGFRVRQATMSWTTPVKPSPPSGKSSLKGPFWVSWMAWNGTNGPMEWWLWRHDDIWLVCCQLSYSNHILHLAALKALASSYLFSNYVSPLFPELRPGKFMRCVRSDLPCCIFASFGCLARLQSVVNHPRNSWCMGSSGNIGRP